jgi:hypothetical protein
MASLEKGGFVAHKMYWGCHQLGKLGSAKHHPQKDIFRVKRGDYRYLF